MSIQNWPIFVIVEFTPTELGIDNELRDLLSTVRQSINIDVIIDFSSIENISTNGMDLLCRIRKIVDENDQKLLLCSVSLALATTFVVAGEIDFFDFEEEKLTAIASLQKTK